MRLLNNLLCYVVSFSLSRTCMFFFIFVTDECTYLWFYASFTNTAIRSSHICATCVSFFMCESLCLCFVVVSKNIAEEKHFLFCRALARHGCVCVYVKILFLFYNMLKKQLWYVNKHFHNPYNMLFC
jgi:hypothetical protein